MAVAVTDGGQSPNVPRDFAMALVLFLLNFGTNANIPHWSPFLFFAAAAWFFVILVIFLREAEIPRSAVLIPWAVWTKRITQATASEYAEGMVYRLGGLFYVGGLWFFQLGWYAAGGQLSSGFQANSSWWCGWFMLLMLLVINFGLRYYQQRKAAMS